MTRKTIRKILREYNLGTEIENTEEAKPYDMEDLDSFVRILGKEVEKRINDKAASYLQYGGKKHTYAAQHILEELIKLLQAAV